MNITIDNFEFRNHSDILHEKLSPIFEKDWAFLFFTLICSI